MMVMKPEEKIRIMQMVQNGTITPEEALQLLEGIERKLNDVPGQSSGSVGGPPKWARILITDMDSGKVRVNIRMPLGLINAGRKMGARIAPGMDGMNIDDLFQGANLSEPGRVIEVYDDTDREHIEIFVE